MFIKTTQFVMLLAKEILYNVISHKYFNNVNTIGIVKTVLIIQYINHCYGEVICFCIARGRKRT